MDDDQIAAALGPLAVHGFDDIPHEGQWLSPPYPSDPNGRAIILNDGDFQFIVVDRATGEVRSCCEDDDALMASSPRQLTAIATLWGSIDRDAIGPGDDEEFARVAASFEQQLKSIDPAAAAPNEFWSLYAEELSRGDL
ncbi:MAG: SUKH-4 family immunity protein [Actinomycetales bacterium]|jgi:hypothetical protein